MDGSVTSQETQPSGRAWSRAGIALLVLAAVGVAWHAVRLHGSDDTPWGLLAATASLVALSIRHRVWRQGSGAGGRSAPAPAPAATVTAPAGAGDEIRLFRAIGQSTADMVFVKDLAGRYVSYNRAASLGTGLAVADVLGRTDAELFDADTAARLAANDRAAIASESPLVFEEAVSSRAGFLQWRCTKSRLVDDEGQLLGVLGVSRDLAETRRVERALRDSEAHHRSVVSALNEGILVCDPQGTLLSCNPAAERMTGMTQADWRGGSVIPPGWRARRPDGSPMALADMPTMRVLAGEPAIHDLLTLATRPDGVTLSFEISAVPVPNPDTGALMAVVTSFADVTSRKQMEHELAQIRLDLEGKVSRRTLALQFANDALENSARFNRTITDSIPGKVAYWDAKQRFRFVNPSYAAWFGTTPEHILGRKVSDVFDDEQMDAVRPRIAAALAGEAQHFEREHRQADGRRFVHQVHYVPELVEAEVRGVYVMGFDITDLKDAERELQLANDALAASRDQARAATRPRAPSSPT